jgi:hypothetical protein
VRVAHPARYLHCLSRTGSVILLFASIRCLWGQSSPVSPGGPWHSPDEQRIVTEARRFRSSLVHIDPERVYSLAELIWRRPTTLKRESPGKALCTGWRTRSCPQRIVSCGGRGRNGRRGSLRAVLSGNGFILPDRAGTELHPFRLRRAPREDRWECPPPHEFAFSR